MSVREKLLSITTHRKPFRFIVSRVGTPPVRLSMRMPFAEFGHDDHLQQFFFFFLVVVEEREGEFQVFAHG